jgi:hypothetical protein
MAVEGLAFQYAKQLTQSTVEHILKNPVYYGDFLWNGKAYRGSHPLLSLVSCGNGHRKHSERPIIPSTQNAISPSSAC